MSTVTEKAVFVETPFMGVSSTTLEEDGQYLRVTLDKAENFKVSAGIRLKEMLENKYNGDREALKEWYEKNVERWEGEYFQHRAWETVNKYLGTVIKHGENAAAEFERQAIRRKEWHKGYKRARSDRSREQNQALTEKYTLPPRETLRPYTPPPGPTPEQIAANRAAFEAERARYNSPEAVADRERARQDLEAERRSSVQRNAHPDEVAMVEKVIERADGTRLDCFGGYPSQYMILGSLVIWATVDHDGGPDLTVDPISMFLEGKEHWLDDEEDE